MRIFAFILVAILCQISPSICSRFGRLHWPSDGEVRLQVSPFGTQPNAVGSLALILDNFIDPTVTTNWVKLELAMQALKPSNSRTYSGTISLTLFNNSKLEFKIGNRLYSAFNSTCQSDDFKIETLISKSAKALIWRTFHWEAKDFLQLPQLSATVGTDNEIVDSFLNAQPLQCSENIVGESVSNKRRRNGQSDDLENVDELILLRNSYTLSYYGNAKPKVVAFEQDLDQSSEYFKQNSNQVEKCKQNCQPAFIYRPPKSQEFGCRPIGDDSAEEWWQCLEFGIQDYFSLVGTSGEMFNRQKLAASPGAILHKPVPCFDIRNDNKEGQWQRYVDGHYQQWHSEAWPIDTAYRCLSQQDGSILKEVYLYGSHEPIHHCDQSGNDTVEIGTLTRIDFSCQSVPILESCLDANNGEFCLGNISVQIEPDSVIHYWPRFRQLFKINIEQNTDNLLDITVSIENMTSSVISRLSGTSYSVLIKFHRPFEDLDLTHFVGRFHLVKPETTTQAITTTMLETTALVETTTSMEVLPIATPEVTSSDMSNMINVEWDTVSLGSGFPITIEDDVQTTTVTTHEITTAVETFEFKDPRSTTVKNFESTPKSESATFNFGSTKTTTNNRFIQSKPQSESNF